MVVLHKKKHVTVEITEDKGDLLWKLVIVAQKIVSKGEMYASWLIIPSLLVCGGPSRGDTELRHVILCQAC